MRRSIYPILEFDPTPEALIEPTHIRRRHDVPEHCVICFFHEVIDQVAAEHHAQIISDDHWEDGPHRIYEIKHRDRRLAFFHPGVGGPIAAGLLEGAIASGCRKFMVCGGCGVLAQDIAVGHLIIVASAVRDEGTSYHYLPPGREVEADRSGVAALTATLEQQGVAHVIGKTWTTDAPYRETPGKIAARRNEGCLTVEMEAASLMAVAQFRGVTLGQVLYGGDDVSGDKWDNRDWQSRREIRQNLFWLAADACLKL